MYGAKKKTTAKLYCITRYFHANSHKVLVNLQKLSACVFPSTVKLRKFSLTKTKCYTVIEFAIAFVS